MVAFLIDWSPIWLVVLVPMIGLLAAGDLDCLNSIYGSGSTYCSRAAAGFWESVQFVAILPASAYFLWNFCYRQGRTGQSIGKSVMKFMVVSEKTWQPIGFWMSLVRHIANYVNRFTCYVGYFWPLWDNKRQTLADKIMGTVCVPVQRNALTPVNASPMTN